MLYSLKQENCPHSTSQNSSPRPLTSKLSLILNTFPQPVRRLMTTVHLPFPSPDYFFTPGIFIAQKKAWYSNTQPYS